MSEQKAISHREGGQPMGVGKAAPSPPPPPNCDDVRAELHSVRKEYNELRRLHAAIFGVIQELADVHRQQQSAGDLRLDSQQTTSLAVREDALIRWLVQLITE